MVQPKAFTFPHSNFIGFDHIWNEIERLTNTQQQSDYPKHNVVKHTETEFSIELALAGFKREDLEIEVKSGVLVIRGNCDNSDTARSYLHKGISTKKFVRTFRLSEHVVVDGADFVDGLLVIDLRVELPEAQRPRKIEIGTVERPQLLNEG